MIFSCSEMVEELSAVFTLEPGDVVSTGTPSGVGASFDPPQWLVPGDSVRIEIEGIGILENPVIDGRAPNHS
jgi:2-keto-4-pentenoate hydratase/2-oxohepta-3-ene-1,7-dioic acid hydratase in catechol pathway